MKIGVISDTHDRLASLKYALAILAAQKIEALVHCGDWTSPSVVEQVISFCSRRRIPLLGVLGNRDDQEALSQFTGKQDVMVRLPADDQSVACTIDKRKMIVYHGHHKPTLRRLVEEAEYDVLFTGHTHKPLITYEQEMLVVNPGSTAFSIPRRREPRSVALYDSVDNTARLLYFEAVAIKDGATGKLLS